RRPDGKHVEVLEWHPGARPEILVADVPSPYNRHVAVGDEGLVVHAPVETLEIAEIPEGASAANHEGVVEANLDVWLGRERGEGRFDPLRVLVVDEDAHAHPAPCRLP